MMNELIQGFLVLLFVVTINASSPSSLSYYGAVVEYRPVTEGENGRKVAVQNAVNFRTIVNKAHELAGQIDIIVFPEIGLTSLPENRSWTIEKIRAHHHYAASYIPAPEDKVVLCNAGNRYSEALKIVSCAAREHRTYIVANHHEKLDCPAVRSDCPASGFLLYNTNVVFDRQGQLIARYRKFNLFSEPGINITGQPERSTFETDFGVTFGQIICNDILYAKPALELNVTDLAFSAEWFSELPFLTSLETHAAWALANDVNLLSSGFNEPAITNGGSGIYLGKRGVLRATVPNVAGNFIVVAEIPKIVNGQRQHLTNPMKPKVYQFSQTEVSSTWDETEKFMYKDDFSLYTTETVDPKRPSYNKTICNRGLCCDFKLETSFDQSIAKESDNYYRYRIGVFNGVRLFAGVLTVGIEVCGLFFCRDNSLASCGERYKVTRVLEPTTFKSLAIERAGDDKDRHKLYLPVTLTNNRLLPVDASKIEYKASAGILRMALTREESELLAFAIYGRNLARDGS